ncbi:hypothetical protein Salat_2585700 [Sesamum alatum]|uniref:Uncharacterized protein n=1 Tax=Sesamum alatum TaxID=300844 RepID=A0AAE1XMX4_9LAMI|nr:hypothetical protein Salat_2585700 [Sesamum alatum]
MPTTHTVARPRKTPQRTGSPRTRTKQTTKGLAHSVTKTRTQRPLRLVHNNHKRRLAQRSISQRYGDCISLDYLATSMNPPSDFTGIGFGNQGKTTEVEGDGGGKIHERGRFEAADDQKLRGKGGGFFWEREKPTYQMKEGFLTNKKP